MPEVTDLMRVAQYVKSDRDAPSDVYNAACRMLDKPAPKTSEELERRIAEVLTHHRSNGLCPLDGPCGDCDCFDPQHEYERTHARAVMTEIVDPALERLSETLATIERVKAFAAELRTYCSPAGIAAVYADSLETVINGAESNGDGRTPQTLGTGEGQEAGEAQEGSQ